MWALLILFVVPVYCGHFSACDMPPSTQGGLEPIDSIHIPVNETDLNNRCSMVTDLVEHLHRFDLACEGRSRFKGLEPPLNYNRIKSFLGDVCDRTGTYHNTLLRQLHCIKVQYDDRHLRCRTSRDEVITAYRIYLSLNHEILRKVQRADKGRIGEDCMITITNVACVIENIRKNCGFGAYEIVHDAVTRTQILPYDCGLRLFDILSGIIDDLKLDSKIKEGLKKYFVLEFE